MQRIPASVFVAPLVLAFIFASALADRDRLGFRDVSHFYTPLFDHVAKRQHESWLPLWNDADHTGIPLAGETTTAFFYPIRIAIYALPLSPTSAIAWYVWMHLSLASITAWIVARWHGTSRTSACLAAIAYAFSGAVFFLHTNLPFLIGATWLPLALGPMFCSHQSLKRRRVAWVALSLTMMILGGDPQTALHAVMILASVRLTQKLRRTATTMRLRDLVKAVALTGFMSAPQLAASIDWSLQSDRAYKSESVSDIFRAPDVESPRNEAFAFSIPPWHVAELLSPKPFGRLYPVNTRMSLRFVDEARMWTPSLYMGLFMGISILAIQTRWNRRKTDRWFLLSLIGLAASLGAYGVVWVAQAFTGHFSQYDGSAGGLYWLLYWGFPGYDAFRYPAKWLPFFAIGLSISTARLMDRPSSVERIRRLLAPALIILSLATIASWAIDLSQQIILSPVQALIPKDPFWGPLQFGLAWQEITKSLLHSSIAAAGLLMAFWLQTRYHWTHWRLQVAITTVVLIDVSIAANQQVLKISVAEEQAILQAANEIQEKQSVPPPSTENSRWLRTRSGSGWPRVWQETTASHRALEVESAGRLNWFGRWHLQDEASVFNSATSIRSSAVASFWKATQTLNQQNSTNQNIESWRRIREWLQIDGVMTTKSESTEIPTQTRIYQLPTISRRVTPHDTQNPLSTHHPLTPQHPRCVLVASRQWLDLPKQQPTEKSMLRRLREITEPVDRSDQSENAVPPTITTEDHPWFMVSETTGSTKHHRVSRTVSQKSSTTSSEIAASSLPESQKNAAATNQIDKEVGTTIGPSNQNVVSCYCVAADNEGAIFKIESAQTLLLSRAIYQDGNWTCRYLSEGSSDWRTLDVGQVDFLKQGVIVPAGKHEIRFTYQPWWITPSFILSGFGWLLLGTLAAAKNIRSQAPQDDSLTNAESTKNSIEKIIRVDGTGHLTDRLSK